MHRRCLSTIFHLQIKWDSFDISATYSNNIARFTTHLIFLTRYL